MYIDTEIIYTGKLPPNIQTGKKISLVGVAALGRQPVSTHSRPLLIGYDG